MKVPDVRLDWTQSPFGIFRDPHFHRQGRWILLSAVVGVVAGLGAILFDLSYEWAQQFFLEGIGGFRPPTPGTEGDPGFGPGAPWRLIVSLTLGGLITGVIIFFVAPETEGHGTDSVILAFHHLRGRIRKRVPLVKAITAAVNIGSGGSAGREGPTCQIGAGFGSFLGDVLKLRNHDRRVLMMAGVAGGIGAIFRAPLGAAFFAAEVLYREPEFEYEVLLPGLISAIVGYSVYATWAGWGIFLFDVPAISYHRPAHLAAYAVLGLICAMAGRSFPPLFYGIRDRIFRPLKLPGWSKPALGGLALGVVALVFPEALGTGYGYIQEAIDGQRAVGFLMAMAAVKMLATSLTLSSGGSGGVFGPCLVIGGALGGAFGLYAGEFAPDLTPALASCIMVGMCGFFAGVAKAPLAAVIMVTEMTGSYGLLVPSLLVATIAYLTVPPAVGIYENQVSSRVESPSHTGFFAAEALRTGRVADAFQPLDSGVALLREGTTLEEIVRLAAEGQQPVYPVVDREGRLRGEVTLDEVRLALHEDIPPRLVVAADLMRRVAEPLVPGDDLHRAARLLARHGSEAVSVVKDAAGREVVGLFGRRDLIVAYGSREEGEGPDSLEDPAPPAAP